MAEKWTIRRNKDVSLNTAVLSFYPLQSNLQRLQNRMCITPDIQPPVQIICF